MTEVNVETRSPQAANHEFPPLAKVTGWRNEKTGRDGIYLDTRRFAGCLFFSCRGDAIRKPGRASARRVCTTGLTPAQTQPRAPPRADIQQAINGLLS